MEASEVEQLYREIRGLASVEGSRMVVSFIGASFLKITLAEGWSLPKTMHRFLVDSVEEIRTLLRGHGWALRNGLTDHRTVSGG